MRHMLRIPPFRIPPFRLNPRRHVDRPTGPPNPFEAGLLIVCVIQGAGVVFGIAQPSSISASLGPCLRLVWALLLFLGGTAAVVGLWWPWDPIDGVLVKRVGLLAAAGGTLAYGLALAFLGPPGYIAAAYNLGFAVVCVIRAWQVTIALTMYRMHLAVISAATTPSPEEGEGST